MKERRKVGDFRQSKDFIGYVQVNSWELRAWPAILLMANSARPPNMRQTWDALTRASAVRYKSASFSRQKAGQVCACSCAPGNEARDQGRLFDGRSTSAAKRGNHCAPGLAKPPPG